MIGWLQTLGYGGPGLESWLATVSLLLLCGMMLMAVFNTLTAPRAEQFLMNRNSLPKVSLLIPARNEAHNLPVLAEHLARIDYPDLEIILLDDASEDGTGAALGDLVQQVPRARALRGLALPGDWLGKNWACHQLARAAAGDVMIFCDADARPGPQSVLRTVSLLERYGVGCATLMPRQVLGSWAERAVIPVLLHMSLFCFLPLALVPRLPWKKLGVANGQWIAFTRKAYQAVGGHAAVRDKVVEDIALGQRAQATRQGLVVALAPRTIAVRMYRNAGEVWEGFGKNMFILTGGTFWKTPFYGLFFALIHVLPWLLVFTSPRLWAVPLAVLVACRLLTAHALGEPPRALVGQCAGSLIVPLIAARSLRDFQTKQLQWKGRILNTTPAFTSSLDPSDSPNVSPRSKDTL